MTPIEHLEAAERNLKAIIQGAEPLTQAQWDATCTALTEVRCAKIKLESLEAKRIKEANP